MTRAILIDPFTETVMDVTMVYLYLIYQEIVLIQEIQDLRI